METADKEEVLKGGEDGAIVVARKCGKVHKRVCFAVLEWPVSKTLRINGGRERGREGEGERKRKGTWGSFLLESVK